MISGPASLYYNIKPIIKHLIFRPLRHSRSEVIRITTLQFVSAGLQATGFIIIIRFVSLIMNDWLMTFQGQVHDLSTHRITVFWIIFALSLFFMLSGAWFNYLARKITAKLARTTEERILHQVTETFVESFSSPPERMIDLPDLSSLKSFYNRGGRFAGRMVMALTSSLVPLIIMIVSLILLFYLKPVLTAFLIIILILAIPVFLSIAQKGRQASEGILKNARNSTLDKNRHIDYLRFSLFRPDKGTTDDALWINQTSSAENFMKAYEQRLRITALSTFVVQTLIVIMLAAIFLAAIYPVVVDIDFFVDSVLIYLVTFKFFGSGLIACINALIIINVFYSYCKRLVPFLELSDRKYDNKYLTEAVEEIEHGGIKLKLFPGKAMLINLHVQVDWSNIKFVLQSLSNHIELPVRDYDRRTAFLSLQPPMFGENMPESIRRIDAPRAEEIIHYLGEIEAVDESFTKYLKHIEPDVFSDPKWNKMPNEVKLFSKGLIIRERSEPWLVFIDGSVFSSMSRIMQERLLEILGGHYVFVAVQGNFKYKHFASEFFQTMACVSPEGLQWIGGFSLARDQNITIASFYQSKEVEEELSEIIEEF